MIAIELIEIFIPVLVRDAVGSAGLHDEEGGIALGAVILGVGVAVGLIGSIPHVAVAAKGRAELRIPHCHH